MNHNIKEKTPKSIILDKKNSLHICLKKTVTEKNDNWYSKEKLEFLSAFSEFANGKCQFHAVFAFRYLLRYPHNQLFIL